MYTYQSWKHPVFYNFDYVQYLPKDFDPGRQYPLVLFLHGAGDQLVNWLLSHKKAEK